MSESTDQQALFGLLRRAEPRYPLLRYVFHPANEASGGGAKVRRSYTKRDGSQGYRMVPIEAMTNAAMGVKAGVWDTWAPFRNRAPIWGYRAGAFAGLVVELKSGKNDLTPAQEEWRDFLTAEGWACQVRWEWTAAARDFLTWAGAVPKEWGL